MLIDRLSGNRFGSLEQFVSPIAHRLLTSDSASLRYMKEGHLSHRSRTLLIVRQGDKIDTLGQVSHHPGGQQAPQNVLVPEKTLTTSPSVPAFPKPHFLCCDQSKPRGQLRSSVKGFSLPSLYSKGENQGLPFLLIYPIGWLNKQG